MSGEVRVLCLMYPHVSSLNEQFSQFKFLPKNDLQENFRTVYNEKDKKTL